MKNDNSSPKVGFLKELKCFNRPLVLKLMQRLAKRKTEKLIKKLIIMVSC